MIKKGRIVEVKDPLLETAKERLSSPTTAFEKLQGKALQATQTQTKRGRESSLNDCVALLIKKNYLLPQSYVRSTVRSSLSQIIVLSSSCTWSSAPQLLSVGL
jgi:hypothetical protein